MQLLVTMRLSALSVIDQRATVSEVIGVVNKVLVIGKINGNLENFVTQKAQKTVVRFIVAVEREFKNHNGRIEADYIPVSVYGASADSLLNSGVKNGDWVIINGRIKVIKNKKKDTYFTEIVSMDCRLLPFAPDTCN